jgi:uncharacterized coiled-coil protein SlyX
MDHQEDDFQFRRELEQRLTRDNQLLDELQQELVHLQEKVANLQHRIRLTHEMYQLEFGDEPPSDVGGEVPPKIEWQPRVTISPRHRGGDSWNDAVERVLRETGRPMKAVEVWERLEAEGFATGAKDPKRALATILVRHPHVQRVAPSTYALRDSDNSSETPGALTFQEGVV